MGLFRFVTEAIKHPREVSTAFPSSPFLARAMADQVDFERAETIVELGAGDGALTDPLIEGLKPGAELLLIEVNEKFCSELREQYRSHEKWDQIEVLNREAQNLDQICNERDIDGVDAVVSGLPLTSLPDDLSDEILDVIYDVLNPRGTYVQFTYWTMTLINDFREDMRPVFGEPRRDNVPINLLPAVVYAADKNTNGNGTGNQE